jgi:hypothetical protein
LSSAWSATGVRSEESDIVVVVYSVFACGWSLEVVLETGKTAANGSTADSHTIYQDLVLNPDGSCKQLLSYQRT